MSLNFTRFINACTPYKGLAHLVNVQTSSQQTALRVAAFVLSIASLGLLALASHLFCRYKFRYHALAVRPQDARIEPIQRALFGQNKLDLSSIEQFEPFKLEHFLAEGMQHVVSVGPYKPCGYSEFVPSTYAQGGDLRSQEDFKKRLKDVKDTAATLSHLHKYDNQSSMRYTELGDEYWAAHPSSIAELCRLNISLLKPISLEHPHSLMLIDDLKGALRDRDDRRAADAFMELAKIPSSLPHELFAACFGDVKGLGRHPHVKLTKSLHELKKLSDEFKQHSIETLWQVVAFYHRQGSSDPTAQARAILKTIDPVFEYVVQQNKLLKIKP